LSFRKKFFLSLFITASVLFANAQTTELMVKTGASGVYLEHKVVAKEGMYSIGRIYNVHPKFLAAYNKIDLNKGLNIGQVIHIPLTDTNFSQQLYMGTPVYYKVGANEGLLKVSNQNNKVTLANLREWNNLASDKVAAGTKLIVGFLVTKDAAPVIANTPVKSQEPVIKQPEEKTVVNEPVTAAPPVIIEEKKDDPVQQPPVIKEEPKQAPVVKRDPVPDISNGYFKASFDQQVRTNPASKNSTVTSGIFKTTSGWQDAKYYLLIDGVSPGTIVKIVNPDNNKAVYAKVLGEMNGIRQNQGLDIRISNAAAAALQVTEEEKFVVRLNY
jgi:LysM repeat protein